MNTTNDTTQYDLNNSRQSNSLFTAGAIPIILSLLVPAPAILADILLAFCMFVGAAIAIIAFSNIKSADLKGFAGMAISASVVRIFTSIILVRLILKSATAGIIAEKLSSPMLTNALLSTIAAAALILILASFSMHRAGIIANLKTQFFDNILKDRQEYVASASQLNTIDRDQADRIRIETNTISSFFATITACSRFIFCENILAICALIFGIAGIITVSATPDFPPDQAMAKACQLAIAVSLLTALSLLSSISMSKISLYYFESAKIINYDTEQETVQRRKVSSTIAEPIIECEPAIDVTPIDKEQDTQISQNNNSANVRDTDWHTENDLTKFKLWQKQNLQNSKTIKTIADVITGKSFDEEKTILIASDNIKSLPVTVPVNIAVELSNAGLKCLIVDLDLKREAISRVFDIAKQSYDAQQYITDSGVDGISLICADLINDSSPEKILSIIESSIREDDRIFIYAPDILLSDKVELISTCSKSAMLFGPETDYNENMFKLRENLAECNCDIIEPDEVIFES